MTTVDPTALAEEAYRILVDDLQRHGNLLSTLHRAALRGLVDVFAEYAIGRRSGRLAVPLPTGMGKTSAVIAFLTALHRLDHAVPVSVAASKVEALCSIKRELRAHGVPENWIGLKHSHHDASEPSTGNESRVFQLVTHARIRSGSDFDLFAEHEGQPRTLCIYDETFMRADAFALNAATLRAAVAVLRIQIEERDDPAARDLLAFMEAADSRIKESCDTLSREGDDNANGRELKLPGLSPSTLETHKATLARLSGNLRGFANVMATLLDEAQGPWRVVVGSGQGDGVVTAREAVPRKLRNVVILDASAAVRELVALDPTVQQWQDFDDVTLKDFSAVAVHQIVSPGGRSTTTAMLASAGREPSAVAREVATILRDGWATERAFLIFTFNRRDKDPQVLLKQQLRALGIDVDAKTAEGQNRISWLTWGQETSLNGLEHCTSVIMAGVLHRGHLDLSAQARGQAGHLADSVTSETIRSLVESEVAHIIYQGASRGSCRRVIDGRAQAMRLWFIHKDPSIRKLLERVMPGATWMQIDPRHMKKAFADTKATQLLGRLLGYLNELPETIDKVSSRQVKAALELADDSATKRAFSRAVDLLDPDVHRWQLEGRSLVRAPEDGDLDVLGI